MSVWKSDEKLLIFASLISPSKIILFEITSSIRHSVSSPDETPCSSSKYSTVHRIFNSLLSVSSGDETLHPMLDHAYDFDCEFAKM